MNCCGVFVMPVAGRSHAQVDLEADQSHREEVKEIMEYSVTVWRTPVREWKEVLYRLTYRREWIPERNCWRDVLLRCQRIEG